jgi:hypothetical protein
MKIKKFPTALHAMEYRVPALHLCNKAMGIALPAVQFSFRLSLDEFRLGTFTFLTSDKNSRIATQNLVQELCKVSPAA